MPWGERVPDHLFLHFVLPYRVNTENIEDFRGILYNELAERTAKLSMADAILETNYWCHEKATYIGADLRTISPLTMIRNARGRRGEESTLAVAALRSIGIPARQVYTPRWAHCDSNHAWVEAWADGQWYYIGACEPEARLNQGWFSPPVRRAMLINTRIFADYPGPEDITLNEKGFTEINLLENYAPARTLYVSVKDKQESPYPAQAFDLSCIIWLNFIRLPKSRLIRKGRHPLKPVMATSWFARSAAANGVKSCSRPRTANISNLCLIHPNSRQGSWISIWFLRRREKEMPRRRRREEKIQAHNRRLEEGTKVRTEYEGTFLSEEEAFTLAQSSGLPPERVWDVLQKPGQQQGNRRVPGGAYRRIWRVATAVAGVVERKGFD